MSDSIKGFYVVLEKDIGEEQFEALKTAVLMIRGVLAVNESVSDSSDWMARRQVGHEMEMAIYETMRKLSGR
jgi:hypothetical protein